MTPQTHPPLKSVYVCEDVDGIEHYEVGKNDVTAVEWHSQNGHMAAIPTIRVFVGGKLHSEHPFHNLIGVYYAEGQPE